MHVFDQKNWISIFWFLYFPVFCAKICQNQTAQWKNAAVRARTFLLSFSRAIFCLKEHNCCSQWNKCPRTNSKPIHFTHLELLFSRMSFLHQVPFSGYGLLSDQWRFGDLREMHMTNVMFSQKEVEIDTCVHLCKQFGIMTMNLPVFAHSLWSSKQVAASKRFAQFNQLNWEKGELAAHEASTRFSVFGTKSGLVVADDRGQFPEKTHKKAKFCDLPGRFTNKPSHC